VPHLGMAYIGTHWSTLRRKKIIESYASQTIMRAETASNSSTTRRSLDRQSSRQRSRITNGRSLLLMAAHCSPDALPRYSKCYRGRSRPHRSVQPQGRRASRSRKGLLAPRSLAGPSNRKLTGEIDSLIGEFERLRGKAAN
jgi:hypothetical protein